MFLFFKIRIINFVFNFSRWRGDYLGDPSVNPDHLLYSSSLAKENATKRDVLFSALTSKFNRKNKVHGRAIVFTRDKILKMNPSKKYKVNTILNIHLSYPKNPISSDEILFSLYNYFRLCSLSPFPT